MIAPIVFGSSDCTPGNQPLPIVVIPPTNEPHWWWLVPGIPQLLFAGTSAICPIVPKYLGGGVAEHISETQRFSLKSKAIFDKLPDPWAMQPVGKQIRLLLVVLDSTNVSCQVI